MVKFVVLESKRSSKNWSFARIHKASCGHAKEPNYKTTSTICHGYFDRYYEAMDFARARARAWVCSNCGKVKFTRGEAAEAE